MNRKLACNVLLLLLASVSRTAVALDLAQQPFTLRMWDRPDVVNQLLQARDGMVWLATRTGLTRFDGERFVDIDMSEYARRSQVWVRRLLSTADGSVWAATGAGSLELTADPLPRLIPRHGEPTAALVRLLPYLPAADPDRLIRLSPSARLPDPWVWALAEGPDGDVWVGTENGLAHVRQQQAEVFSTSHGLPANFVTSLAFGPDGSMYVGTSAGVVVHRGGRFTPTPIAEPVLALAVDGARRLWAIAQGRILRVDPEGTTKSFIAREPDGMALDLSDNLWVADSLRVFARGEPAALSQQVVPHLRITGVTVDRDGSLWLTLREGGLLQVSVPRVRSFGPEEGLLGRVAFSVLHANDDSMFVATDGGISRHAKGSWTTWPNSPRFGTGPRDLAEGPSDSANAGLWVASEPHIHHGVGQGFRLVRRPDRPPRPGSSDGFHSVVAARNGDLWVTEWPVGLLRFPRAELQRQPIEMRQEDGLCSGHLTHGMQASDGSLWFAMYYGTQGAGVTRIKNGHARCYGPADGLPSAQVGAVVEDREGTIWLGTAWGAGLIRFRHEQFAVVPPAAGIPRDNIVGILDDGRGHLWLCSELGVYRVPKVDLERCANGPCPGVRATVFGRREGMRSPECTGAFHPNMAVDGKGNVWVATLRGVSVFPPLQQEQRPALAPIIEDIVVDGTSVPFRMGGELRLGPRARDLLIHYTVPSFLGERPVLRHRLHGFDADWTTSGTPAVAHYQDLPSGSHGLELGAGDRPGNVTRLTIVASPPFWRSRGFAALMVTVLGLGALAFHRVRIVRLKLRHETITEERARIARDLHDGLAQKLRAIGLLSDRVRASVHAQPSEKELSEIGHIVAEAHGELRRTIWDMRSEAANEQRLEKAIERIVSDLQIPAGIRVTLRTAGESVPLSGLTMHEVPLVVKEALVNSLRHASATKIEVGVLSDDEGLQTWVRDDGQGFSAEGLGRNHIGAGIIGMHERARRLGASLVIQSQPGGGTEVSLTVPRATEQKRAT